MAEWAFDIAINEHDCSKCGSKKGILCRMPSGRLSRNPHGERVKCLTKKDWDRCKGVAMSAMEALTIYK